MRYIAGSQVKRKMVLARSIYGPNFEIMLRAGIQLSENHIKRINDLGYSGIYIEDEISEDIKVEDIIPTELRMRLVKSAKEILQEAEKGGAAAKVTRDNQNRIIQPVIDALIDNRKRIVDLIDLKPFDDYIYYHTANVVVLSLLIGVELGVSGSQLYELGMAALLHDVGNIFIPKVILDKPGQLTPEEFEIVKSHSQMGFEYLREHFSVSIECCMGALQHHENYDGSGYPNNLKQEKISIYGRIIAVTDVYDALTSRRPFRRQVYPPAAMDYMDTRKGTMFDPQILDAMKRVVAFYPTGCRVELDTGATGVVVENYHGHSARPRVKLLDDTGLPVYMNLHIDPSCRRINVLEIIDY